ncbi:dTDP-4-dehydrorhamnose 3,5-epimerase family protein [Patescibacteria group bacterium]
MSDKIFGVQGGPIEGVVVKKLNKIPDERGCIFHMLKKEDEEFNDFGEIYFSSVYSGAIKAWHIHKEMELNYAVITGNIKFVLYDDREGSKTRGNLMEIFMGDKNYLLVKVPTMVWNGFKGIADESIIANCTTMSHRADEIDRLDPFSDKIPYEWDIVHG